MKTILRWILAGAIAGSPLLAGQEPKTQEPEPQEEKPKPKPAPKPEKPKQEPAPPSQEPKPEQKEQKEQEKRQKEQKEQSKQGKQTQAPSAQGGHARGQKIPSPKFRASFGKEHRFHVERSAADSRRFQSGGYWFEVVEVWPAGWSFDDECYIEEDGDDYYIVDYIHPELRVLVIAVEG